MQNFAEIKSPQWANVEQTMLDLQVRLDGSDVFVPYCAMVCGETQATDLFNRASNGEFGEIAPVSVARYEVKVRGQRDVLLQASDWSQLPDVPQSIRDKWTPYRQALRDIPSQSGFPFNVTWPTSPTV